MRALLPTGFLAFRLPDKAVEMYTVNMLEGQSDSRKPSFVVTSFNEERRRLYCHLNTPTDQFIVDYFWDGAQVDETSKNHYLTMVEKAIAEIKNGILHKVVLSRNKHFTIGNDFDLEKAFLTLCEAYPHCFVCCVSTTEIGTWLGASPELILRKTEDIIETFSLAGTKQVADKTAWGEKEKEEQSIVTRYILEVLKQNSLTSDIPYPTSELYMGDLRHMVTHFKANIPDDFDEQKFLANLSPTPAVCGFPKAEAMQFILENEDYFRYYYTGNWGIQSPSELHLYVNLRCMQLYKNKGILYAGAGITSDSDPQKEWLETEAKMKLLGNLLLGD
ncbi:MAG: isochorismate synthase [Flavobacteriaceae bacterium]|nr:isochorismate synthase [Flavobacteriaceae bacterium]